MPTAKVELVPIPLLSTKKRIYICDRFLENQPKRGKQFFFSIIGVQASGAASSSLLP